MWARSRETYTVLARYGSTSGRDLGPGCNRQPTHFTTASLRRIRQMPDKSRTTDSLGSDKPSYNDNPAFLRGHLEDLYEWLPAEDANHLNLAGGHFMVINRKTITISAEHAAAIKDGTVATPSDFRETFLKPIDPKRWKTTSTPLPAADSERFSIQPEAIKTGMNEFLADIVSTFEDTESGKDAKREAGNCPITLLNMMKDEADNITNTMVGKIDDLMSKMMADGLPSPKLAGFSAFRKSYTALNRALHDDEQLSNAKLAKRFAKVVRGLGTVAETSLRFEMLRLSADGNLNLTIKAIKTVLGDLEASDMDGSLGAALTAGARRDPAIYPSPPPGGGYGGGGDGGGGFGGDRKKGHPDRPFDSARDRPCFNCKEGKHWTADCDKPRRDSAKARKAIKWRERKESKAKRDAAAAAPAHGKAGRGSSGDDATQDTADTLFTASPLLIQDAEAQLAAAFAAEGISLCEDADDTLSELSEKESDDESDYDQADHFTGQASMGRSTAPAPSPDPATPSVATTPTPAPSTGFITPIPAQQAVWLSWRQARAAVASLESNPPLRELRETIESTGLPVSPGTGGVARRTKLDILAEMRALVGLSPLTATVEMGIAVEESTPPPPLPPPEPAVLAPPAVPLHSAAAAPAATPVPPTVPLAAERTARSAIGTRIARASSARRAWPRLANAIRAKRGGLISAKPAIAAAVTPPHRGLRGMLFCFTFVNFAAMAAMAMAYSFAPSTSSSITIFDDGGGPLPTFGPSIVAQFILPLLCLIAVPACGRHSSRCHLPFCDQARRLLGGVLGRHPHGRPPPSGKLHTVLDSESDRAYSMFREGLRTWAPGWITAFYFLLWIGFCGKRYLHRRVGLGITEHQLPGRGRNVRLRDMVAWLDYSWYHRRGIYWATDTLGMHAAAAIIAPMDVCGMALRRAYDIAHERYTACHWWLFWKRQTCSLSISRALRFTSLYLVSALAHTWHDPAAMPLHAYAAARSCTHATLRAFSHIVLVIAFTAWRISLPLIMRALELAPSAVSAVLFTAHSTPTTIRYLTCTAAYGFGCIVGLVTRIIARTTSQTGVVNERLGRTLVARALTGKRRHKSSCRGSAIWKSFAGACSILAIVDSGCTWHSHPEVKDLINVRPCTDKISCAGGVIHHASHIGDLPVVCHNQAGRERVVLVRDVRCVPSFTDTLVSVRQLWETSEIDTVFRNVDSLTLAQPGPDGTPERLPFRYENGVYLWEVGATARANHLGNTITSPKALSGRDTSGTHGAHATSHIEALSPDQIAAVLHRRLHISLDRIRRLASCTSDAPRALQKASHHHCDDCVTANATRLSHSSDKYSPSYPGRLIHADIAGPFRCSTGKQFRWLLVLIDDHTRFKFVYFLKNKSEAAKKAAEFVAQFNHAASSKSVSPIRVVGHLHMDNAGEFLSREFKEFLDEELISQSTCPPHVHQLNGVAERAIRSIMDQTRAHLVASALPVSFWPHIVQHAVDVLNRTTGPPDSTETSFQSLTGEAPRIMSIMPIGCRAHTVKPMSAVVKTTIDAHAWVGVNLGRSTLSPGSYLVWVPSIGRVVSSSEVYFTERFFPLRPAGEQFVGPDLPSGIPPRSQPPGVPPPAGTSAPPPQPAVPNTPRPAPKSLTEAFDTAVRGARGTASLSRHILLLFSGPYERHDGLAALLRQRGFTVTCIDSDAQHGGGERGDILHDPVYRPLLDLATSGEFLAIIAAPPCSTFSISRFMHSPSSPDGGPPIVRTRGEHIEGLPSLPPGHARETRRANRIVRRMAYIIGSAHGTGTQFIIENPADRGLGDELHVDDRHGPMWLLPIIRLLAIAAATAQVTFAQCMFGAAFQKYTTFMYTPGFQSALGSLSGLRCTHPRGSHRPVGGTKRQSGEWTSGESAAFPSDLNAFLVEACLSLISPSTATPSTPDVLPPAVPETAAAGDASPPNDTPVVDTAPPIAPPPSARRRRPPPRLRPLDHPLVAPAARVQR